MTFFQLTMASYSKYSADGPMLLALWVLAKFKMIGEWGLKRYHMKSIWKRSYRRMKRYDAHRRKMMTAVDNLGTGADIAANLIEQSGVSIANGQEDQIRDALSNGGEISEEVKALMGWDKEAIESMKAEVQTKGMACLQGCGTCCANIGFEWCFGWAVTFVMMGPIMAMAFIFGFELIIAATGFDIFPFHYQTGQPLFLTYEGGDENGEGAKVVKGIQWRKLVRCRWNQGMGRGCCYWFKWNHIACLVRSFVGLFAVLLLPIFEEALPCCKPCFIKVSKVIHGPGVLGILAPEALPKCFWHFELHRLAKGPVKAELKKLAIEVLKGEGGSPDDAALMLL